jgi:hypothetical protein
MEVGERDLYGASRLDAPRTMFAPTVTTAAIPISAASTMLTGILREFLSNFRDVFAGGRQVCIACITVKHQRTGFQFRFESFGAEHNRLLVVVRTYNLEIHADSCAFFLIEPFAASLA